MPWASFSMLDGPGGTGCDVPVRGCWVSRDVIVATVYDCVKECMEFVMYLVSLTRLLQSEVKIIHIIVQNNT